MKTSFFPALCFIVLVAACTQPATKSNQENKQPLTDTTTRLDQQAIDSDPKPITIGDRRIIRTAMGDLNKDNRADSVVVYENAADSTMEDERSRYIEVYFASDRGFTKVAYSDKAVQGYIPSNGADMSELSIKNSVLTIGEEMLAGHYENKFRYQNDHFELIGHEDVESDRQGTMETISYNLSTGQLNYEKARYDTDKVLKKVNTHYKLDSIPTLNNFEPFSIPIKTEGIEIYI